LGNQPGAPGVEEFSGEEFGCALAVVWLYSAQPLPWGSSLLGASERDVEEADVNRRFFFVARRSGVAAAALSLIWVFHVIAQPQKKVKDQGEYDLFTAIVKEGDHSKKIGLLDQWKQKYPDTEFQQERMEFYLRSYAGLGQYSKVIETAKAILAAHPKHIESLYWANFLTPGLHAKEPPPDAVDFADQSANALLSVEMPPNTKPDDWARAKNDLDALAHRTMGWAAMQRKNATAAEQAFRKSLEVKPNQGEVSYWLGMVLRAQRTAEAQSSALFYFARAASLETRDGGLPDPQRKEIDAYLARAYSGYHGQDDAGLAELKALARKSAAPPGGFKIKSATEIAIEKEEEFKKSNPPLALWMSLKKELTGDNGEQFFQSSMKDAHVPGGAGDIQKFKGTLIEARPAARPKELIVGLADPQVPEVTLKLEAPLAGRPEPGSPVEFEGVPVAFAKEPFMVTFDVEKDGVAGLKMGPAAPARRPVARKSAAKK
jgi:tetratricopeptide (TPR) repeat protein